MDIDVFSSAELPTVMRALRTALQPEDPLNAAEQQWLATYARITGQPPLTDTPSTIAPAEVCIASAHARKRLLQLGAAAALLARPVRPAALAFLAALARSLQTQDAVLQVLTALQRGQLRRVRLLTMRRGMRAMLKEAWLAEGWRGVLRIPAAMLLGAPVNRDRLWTFKRLGLLPEGTLGRAYWQHMVTEGFGFPGEPGGIAASVAYHDVAHVLAEHPATPFGEIQQGSFQAGNRREDGFFFLLFVLLHFHQGVTITPGTPPRTGHYDPAAVLWAVHRGASSPVDMTHQWDFWPLMSLPLVEARQRCGLLPRVPPAHPAYRVIGAAGDSTAAAVPGPSARSSAVASSATIGKASTPGIDAAAISASNC